MVSMEVVTELGLQEVKAISRTEAVATPKKLEQQSKVSPGVVPIPECLLVLL